MLIGVYILREARYQDHFSFIHSLFENDKLTIQSMTLSKDEDGEICTLLKVTGKDKEELWAFVTSAVIQVNKRFPGCAKMFAL